MFNIKFYCQTVKLLGLRKILLKVQKGIEAIAFSALLLEVYVTKRKLQDARY